MLGEKHHYSINHYACLYEKHVMPHHLCRTRLKKKAKKRAMHGYRRRHATVFRDHGYSGRSDLAPKSRDKKNASRSARRSVFTRSASGIERKRAEDRMGFFILFFFHLVWLAPWLTARCSSWIVKLHKNHELCVLARIQMHAQETTRVVIYRHGCERK